MKRKTGENKTKQALATLVMGMNLVNTMTPMAMSMQNLPEEAAAIPVQQSEAQPLDYAVLPHTVEFVDSLVFGKAEAATYNVIKGDNTSVDFMGLHESMDILSGGVGTIIHNDGGTQTIYSGGKGTIVTNSSAVGVQYIKGGSGLIENVIRGSQIISSGGIGTIENGGTYCSQIVYSGGYGTIKTMNGGMQDVSGGSGTIINNNGGYQGIYSGGNGFIENNNSGVMRVYSGGSGNIENSFRYGSQIVYSRGSGTIVNMTGGIQFISAGGTGIIENNSAGMQSIQAGGTGKIENLKDFGYQWIMGKGTGTVEDMSGGTVRINSAGILNNAIVNGGTVIAHVGAEVSNLTLNNGGSCAFNDDFLYNDELQYAIKNLNVNGGTVDMVSGGTQRKLGTLTIDSLNGGGATFIMDTDLANEKGDKIIIKNAEAGTHSIEVRDWSFGMNWPARDPEAVEGHKNLLLVTINNGSANFVGKDINNGGLWKGTPKIENGTKVKDDDGNIIGQENEWYLTHIEKAVNNDTEVLLESGDNSYALWRNTNDTLRKHLGDLRYRENGIDGEGIWARYTGGKFGGDRFSGSYHMYQLGYDKAANAKSTYGFAFEKGSGSANYSFGNGKDKLFAGSLYGVWTGADGSYTDVVAKIGQFDSEVNSYGDYPDKADYKNHAYSLSVEYGKNIALSEKAGTFIEPQAQFIVGRLVSAEYKTDRGNNVYLGGVNSYIGRVGFVLGQKTSEGSDVYFKASALHEFGGDRDVSMVAANGEKMSLNKDYGDTWFELGLGTNIKLSRATYFYGDIERSFGAEIQKKWQVNAGLRWSF